MKSKKIRVCVIEDEDNVRKSLVEAINDSKELTVVCEANSVKSGIEAIMDYSPDLIFLDIKLIGGDAFMILDDLIDNGFDIPPVVINTGYDEFEYAQRILNEYKNTVFYILRKPFWENWKEKEATILKKYYEIMYSSETLVKKDDRIIIKSRYKIFVIIIDDIKFLQVARGHKGQGKTLIITDSKEYVINKTLSVIENKLPPNFIRINRFEIINILFVSEYDQGEQMVSLFDYDEKLGVGNTYKENFLLYLDNF